jgi:hypothetical protein
MRSEKRARTATREGLNEARLTAGASRFFVWAPFRRSAGSDSALLGDQSSNFQVTGLTDAERPFFTKRSGPDRLRAIKRSIGVLVRSVMADGSSETALLAVVSKSIGASCIRREAAG